MGEPGENPASYVAEAVGRIVGWASCGPNRDATLPMAGELSTLFMCLRGLSAEGLAADLCQLLQRI